MSDPTSHFCTQCGAAVDPTAHFCGSCGAQVASSGGDATPPPPATPSGDDPTLAMPPVTPSAPASPPPPGGPPPATAPATPPPEGDGVRISKPVIIGIGIVAVLALIAGLVALASDGGDGGDAASDEEGEIFLEPAASLGPSPFADEVLEPEPVPTTTSPSTTAPPTTTGEADVTAVAAIVGDSPGLYGGTGNSARCDREAMIRFLEADPAKAAAWVQALNADPTLRWAGGNRVRTDQIGDYIRELTPVTLTRDTRVTNHGYRNGRPTPRQSVLQAGSAVLVDRYGVPRARCGCGNPLIPPARVRIRPTYVGPPWPGWNPINVVVVTEVSVAIDVFILIDLVTGERIERPAGTTGDDDRIAGTPPTTAAPATTVPPTAPPTTPAPPPTAPLPTQPVPPPQPPPDLGTGDVQVTLEWTGDADLDLHVIDPSGFEIYFGSPTSPSGGALDADEIPGCSENGPHVENVFWPDGGAPSGRYQAFVTNLGSCDSGPVTFDMVVLVGGSPVGGDGGTLGDGGSTDPVVFGF